MARPWPSSTWCMARAAARMSRRPGRVDAEEMAEPGDAPRLVDRGGGADAVAETRHDDLGVVGEPAGDVAVQPAAEVGERRRQLPVVERGVGLQPARQHARRPAGRRNRGPPGSPRRGPRAGCAPRKSRSGRRRSRRRGSGRGPPASGGSGRRRRGPSSAFDDVAGGGGEGVPVARARAAEARALDLVGRRWRRRRGTLRENRCGRS